jgi:transcriptional regulator with XRE-family HTH domain
MNDGALPQTFADLIRTAREAKGWSQEQLEQATIDDGGQHVSVSTISRWERGQAGRPEPSHVRLVCRALGIDPRRAAVSLGYLTAEEVASPMPPVIDPQVQQVLDMLEDPALPLGERQQWIDYLKFLYDRARSTRRAG